MTKVTNFGPVSVTENDVLTVDVASPEGFAWKRPLNSDWSLETGVASILNKPALGTAAALDTGVVNGVCPLNGSVLVDAAYLPSYVDDVIEVDNYASLPVTGETGKIYVTVDDNKVYRWTGTVYIQVIASQVNSDWNETVGVASILNKPDVVIAPSSTTENKIPQWDLVSKKLKDGLTQSEIVTKSAIESVLTGDIGSHWHTSVASLDIHGATEVESVVSDDEFLVYDASASAIRKITKDNLFTGLLTDHWISVASGYTATPASTSTITMTSDLTGTVKPGYGLKYTIGGTVYYGIITAIISNLLTISGASLSGDVSDLYFTKTGMIQMPILIPGYYEDASSTTLLASDLGQTLIWQQGPAYCVRMALKTRVADSSSDGVAQAYIAGSILCTSNTNTGLILDDTDWKWTVVDINTTNYSIAFGEAIEMGTTAGIGKDAQDLSAVLTFVLE